MGTRNLIAVFDGGEYRVAQYSQWDGYPEGQGMTCLHFVRDGMNEEAFRRGLADLSYIDSNSVIARRIEKAFDKGCVDSFPEFDRDTGAAILSIIQHRETTTRFLEDSISFAASWDCEWAWVIDLDKRTFEAYQGYNKTPLTPEDRFYFLRDKEDDETYHAVRMVASWPLDNLPTDKEFLAAFKFEEDEDD